MIDLTKAVIKNQINNRQNVEDYQIDLVYKLEIF